MKRSQENQSLDDSKPGAESPERDESGFLGRWSRRKRGAEVPEQEVPEALLAESEAETPQPLNTTADNTAPQADESQTDPVLTDADMPDIESLNADSDFSPFFSEGVSKELRNLALKKLFFSGKFSARDGLDDYDDDFTKFEPLGDTVTSDMKFHARRKEKARLAELEEQRLLEENAESASTDDAKQELATEKDAEDNLVAEKSEQDTTDSCEPEVIAGDPPEQLPPEESSKESDDEGAVPVASVENPVRTPEG